MIVRDHSMLSRPRVDRLIAVLRTALPVDAAAMALLNLVGGVLYVLSAWLPMSDRAPVALALSFGGVRLALAVVDVRFGRRLPRWALHAQVPLLAAMAGVLICFAHSGVGAMVAALSFPWLAVYAALFFTQGQAFLHAGAVTCISAAAALITAAPVPAVAWVALAASFWTATLVIGTVSRRLRDRAVTDALTGLPNRAGFLQASERELARASRTGEPLCVVMVDLDGLKAINDALGHLAGDALLAEVSHAWRRALRSQDLLARIGGDEFVVLAPDTPLSQADAFLARMYAAHPAAWSAGVAEWEHGETIATCLARADAALYDQKANRRRNPRARLRVTG